MSHDGGVAPRDDALEKAVCELADESAELEYVEAASIENSPYGIGGEYIRS